jgi:hypothetical protein
MMCLEVAKCFTEISIEKESQFCLPLSLSKQCLRTAFAEQDKSFSTLGLSTKLGSCGGFGLRC